MGGQALIGTNTRPALRAAPAVTLAGYCQVILLRVHADATPPPSSGVAAATCGSVGDQFLAVKDFPPFFSPRQEVEYRSLLCVVTLFQGRSVDT